MSRFALAVLLLIFMPACAGITLTPTDSGLEGQVFIGPMCPVVQVGQECPDQPYQATLTVLTTYGKEVVRFRTDPEGRFQVPLASGDYILRPDSPGILPRAAAARPGNRADNRFERGSQPGRP